MMLSRLEIEAAARIVRRAALRGGSAPSIGEAVAPAPCRAFVETCAAEIRAGHGVRSGLVRALSRDVGTGTYSRPAEAIVEQLVGRLVAAALPK